MLYTTLNKIRAHGPCGIGRNDTDGFRKLLNHLGKSTSDDARLSLETILKSNGLADALWCLRAVDSVDWFARRLALDFARSVEHLNPDPRVKACNDTVERFLKKKVTKEEMAAAGAAARDAAWAAARAAAWAAAWAAAGAAAGAAARDAAWAAAGAAAGDAARDAAGDAAGDAARDAAGDAAGDAFAKHFLACLKAWPKGKWPKLKPVTK